MPSLAAEGGTQARWELTVKPCPPCGPSGIPWSLPICVPQPSRRSGLPRTWVHPDARTRGEVPMGDLPLPLPRNMGTNLCLRHVPRHPHHPGHGPPLAPPPPQQMLKLLLVPQKFQGHHSLPSLSRGLIPCKYYDFMGCHGRFSQNPKRWSRHQRQQRCSCPALEFCFLLLKDTFIILN